MTGRVLNIGHRGAAAYAHENTIPSLEEAISRHADMAEFDVRRTADGALILFHDRGIQTPKGRKPVSKLSFDIIQKAAKANGYSVPRFVDVLRQFGSKIAMNIEIKARGFESEIIALLKQYPPSFPPIISSFYPWVVWKLKVSGKPFSTGLIIGREQTYRFAFLTRPILRPLAQKMGIGSIHLQESIVNSRLVKIAHDAGLRLHVWTVDEENRMRELLNLGVDGIITNTPDRLHAVCLEMSGEKKPMLRKVAGEVGKFEYVR